MAKGLNQTWKRRDDLHMLFNFYLPGQKFAQILHPLPTFAVNATSCIGPCPYIVLPDTEETTR